MVETYEEWYAKGNRPLEYRPQQVEREYWGKKQWSRKRFTSNAGLAPSSRTTRHVDVNESKRVADPHGVEAYLAKAFGIKDDD